MKNNQDMDQLMMLLALYVSGGVALSGEQIRAIKQIMAKAVSPETIDYHEPGSSHDSASCKDTIRGLAELAEILGTSIPTANKISKSGRFDAARLYFGTRKLVWDRRKLLEIAQDSNNERK